MKDPINIITDENYDYSTGSWGSYNKTTKSWDPTIPAASGKQIREWIQGEFKRLESKIDESLVLTINYVNGQNRYQFYEGDIQEIQFTVTGKLPAKEAIIYRNGVEYKRQSVIKNQPNRVQLNETLAGTQNIYTVLVIDSLGTLATVGDTEETLLLYTVIYGSVDIQWETVNLTNRIINTETTGINIPFNVMVADSNISYILSVSIKNEEDEYGEVEYEGVSGTSVVVNNLSGNINNKVFTINSFPHGVSILRLLILLEDGSIFYKEYQVIVMNPDEFYLQIYDDVLNYTTDDYIPIRFKVVSGNNVNNFSVSTTVDQKEYRQVVPGNYDSIITLNPISTPQQITVTLTARFGLQSQEESVDVVITQAVHQYSPIDSENGLVVGFSNPSANIEDGTWRNTNTGLSSIKMDLLNAVVSTDLEEGVCVSFGENSYGQVSIPLETISVNGGYTIELYYKANYIGKDDVVLSMSQVLHDTDVKITHDSIYVNDGVNTILSALPENEWVHIAIVYKARQNQSFDLQDNYTKEFTAVYINGVLCKSTLYAQPLNVPQSLNPAIFVLNKYNDVYGNLQLKHFRIYNRFLLSSEVYNNYLSCLSQNKLTAALARKNSDVPIIKFINRNAELMLTLNLQTNVVTVKDSDITLVNFEKTGSVGQINYTNPLNHQTEKSLQKTTGVYCEITYQENVNANPVTYYGIVTTQGTSTLLFPVKNYKMTLYEQANFNKKIKATFGEFLPYAESKFTLKCDYMDSSHLNNTPTCMWFNKVISEALQEELKSPAVQDGYLDAIQGTPCLVMYDEGEGLNTVGTFMLNIDKSGKSLGFELDGKSCQSFEGKANSNTTAGAFVNPNNLTGDALKTYIAQDFEVRYSYDEKEDLIKNDIPKANDNKAWGVIDDSSSTFHWGDEDFETGDGLLRMWSWVTNVSDEDYKNQFEQVFSKTYCMLYYIQLIVFGQVDNPGKNCMWDTWDGKIWYPRPYDLDSELGLNNEGADIVPVFAEINPEMSLDTDRSGLNMEDESGRYSYNTPYSQMWIKFVRHFKDDIDAFYSTLRQNLYTPENIIQFFKTLVVDKLGEPYYNQDFTCKYLNVNDDAIINVANGNRWSKFKDWITKRFVFCDTYFNYKSTEEVDRILIRSGVNATATLQISTKSPQYIWFTLGSNVKLCYFCKDSITIEYPFTFNVEYLIRGRIDNIKLINGIRNVNVTTFNAGGPLTNLIELDVQNCTNLSTFSLGGVGATPYLQKLNITNTRISSIDIPSRISEIIANSTSSLQNLVIPENCAIQKLYCNNSALNGITLKNLPYLSIVQLEGNTYSNQVEFNNLPAIQQFDLAGSTFNSSFSINNVNITSLDLSGLSFNDKVTIIIPLLTALNLSGASAAGIDLGDLSNLTTLNLTGSNISTIYVPEESSIVNLQLASSKINTFGPLGTLSGVVDMSPFNNEDGVSSKLNSSFRFTDANYVTTITNFNWNGSGTNMFRGCYRLGAIENSNIRPTNASHMFHNCSVLTSIDTVTLPTTCTDMSYGFMLANELPLSEIKKIVNTGTQLTNVSYMCYDKKITETSLSVSDFFENTKVSNALSCFLTGNRNNITTITGKLPSTLRGMNFMFYGIASLTSVPVDIFADINPSGENDTISANSMFAGTNITQLVTLPAKLRSAKFMFSGTKVTKDITVGPNTPSIFRGLSKLEDVEGMFRGCPNITGVVDGLFADCPKISNAKLCFRSTTVGCNGGAIFNSTNKDTTKLSIDGLFANPASNARTLTITKDTFADNHINSAGDYMETGAGNSVLVNAAGVFEGRTIQLTNITLQTLIDKFSLSSSLRRMFNDADINYSQSGYPDFTGFSNLTHTNQMFKDCKNLAFSNLGSLNLPNTIQNISEMYCNSGVDDFDVTSLKNKPSLSYTTALFKDNPLMITNITDFTLEGCNNIVDTSNMFYNTGIKGTVNINTFKDCKSTLTNTSGMYMLTNINAIQDGYVDNQNNTIVGGLLARCFNLTNTSKMFQDCNKLFGSLPRFIFYQSEDDRYNYLTDTSYMFYRTSLGEGWEDEEDNNIKYLIHPDMLKSTRNITNMEGMFGYIRYTKDGLTRSYVSIHPNTFDYQYQVQNISNLMVGDNYVSGDLPNIFKNSIGTITNAARAFAFTKISNISSDLLIDTRALNNKLNSVREMFFNTNITSNSTMPQFNNTNKFTKLTTDASVTGIFGGIADVPSAYNVAPYNNATGLDASYAHSATPV